MGKNVWVMLDIVGVLRGEGAREGAGIDFFWFIVGGFICDFSIMFYLKVVIGIFFFVIEDFLF